MNGAAIEFRDVIVDATPSRKNSGEGVVILNGISLRLEAGTTTALLGRSGSGKTTLLRTINGLVAPTSGAVLVNGEVVGSADLLALRRRIGYVIQEIGLYPHLTIERNVAMPLELAGKPLTERLSRAHELLAMTGLDPAKFAERMPWQLSGGQRQRAGVARALAADPAILLLDEPFGALDPLTRVEIQTMLRDLLKKLQKTAVIVTHDLQEAVFLADRILLLDKGNIVADLPSGDVLHSQIPAVKQYVAAVQRFPEAQS
ncbi:ATP-binding cassette domain-containing protein [Terriglobus sp. TAA 43]|uniref:ATP-binding cassette domain-containing protein n=1 Tax=Terriglobus sp. TAA 43 TaxID=278961 RepID=UPI000646B206|nr:ATP-binding cassette domain-containing protein [Terriglobus sp. TAA 43]